MPRFVKNAREGWAVFSDQPVVDKENRSWQLYISVKPTRQNLISALIALEKFVTEEPLFSNPKHPTLKVCLPEDPNQSSHYFDATMPPPSPLMKVTDHDRRGREVCMSMDYDSVRSNYTYDPDVYKLLMLKMWKVLENAGVELNYITPDMDEMVMNCDDEILTPFSYSAKKIEGERHGLLQSSEANLFHFDDPLAGIRITVADLLRHDINGGSAAVVCYKRIEFQEERLEQAKLVMRRLMNAFIDSADQVPNCETVLQRMQALSVILDDECCVSTSIEFLNKVNEWKPWLPCKPNAKLTPIFEENDIRQCLIKQEIPEKAKLLREFFQKIIQRSREEIKSIKIDMDTANSVNPKKLDLAIEHNPASAQGLYRIMFHIENGDNRLEREQNRLLQDCRFPLSYQQIWNECPGTLFDKVRAILSDYTKGGSYFRLIFTGHFNRTISQITTVEQLLNNRHLNDFPRLMSRLKNIPLKDSGSLGTRLAFIMKKNYEELLKQEMNKTPAHPTI